MRKIAYLLMVATLLCAAPVFAQGPFTDVPTDHWAYDAVNQLQRDGIVIGYPDGTFGGKRTITRYEFAVAIARLAQLIPGTVDGKPATGVTQKQLDDAIAGVKADMAKLATKADVDALRKLMDEFRDELASLGVDVDALKRDVAALGARVDALEAEVRRVKFTGDANMFAIAQNSNSPVTGGAVVDLDERNRAFGEDNDTLLSTVQFIRDFDLNVTGRVNESTSAVATMNYGNYLNYLGAVDDFNAAPLIGEDQFFPYWMYIQTALGKGALTVGRLPIQFTPYTLKKIDVDSYTYNIKTDDGNYPIDGAKLAYNFGGVDLTLFAAKNNTNDALINGLTGQPTVGIFNRPQFAVHEGTVGHAVGGLNDVEQSAGVRATVGTPFSGVLGATFYQAWDGSFDTAFNQARVYGADLNIPVPFIPSIGLTASWTQSDTLAETAVADVDYGNIAWDAKLNGSFGSLAINAGYKSIGRNFSAAGYWDSIGRWVNPVNVKGPYADFTFPIMSNLKFNANGEWLQLKDTMLSADAIADGGFWGAKDDVVVKAEGIFSWGFSRNTTLDAGYNWIKYSPDTDGLFTATETYLSLGLGYEMSPGARLNVGYQFINYDNGNTASGPYGPDYRGGQGVVQFGVTF